MHTRLRCGLRPGWTAGAGTTDARAAPYTALPADACAMAAIVEDAVPPCPAPAAVPKPPPPPSPQHVRGAGKPY